MPDVLVPTTRWPRWVDNFVNGHGPSRFEVDDGALSGTAEDGSWFVARLPFGASYDGAAEADAFAAAVTAPARWGVLLVRKGGFAIARVEDGQVVDSKVGRRHVQGKTKAGGQSQQRFARRREKQAREAHEAAAGHAARILTGLTTVVTGGDRAAVAEVLADPRLCDLSADDRWFAVPDPRRAVLDGVVADAQAVSVHVENAP